MVRISSNHTIFISIYFFVFGRTDQAAKTADTVAKTAALTLRTPVFGELDDLLFAEALLLVFLFEEDDCASAAETVVVSVV